MNFAPMKVFQQVTYWTPHYNPAFDSNQFILGTRCHLLAATALATELGMAMGLSELELLMDLSQPALRLRAPALVSPPGGPGAGD